MKILAVIVLTLVSSAISIDQKTRIEAFVQAIMDCRTMPGLSLAVVRGNESWTKGFGTADRERQIGVTTDSLFGIGSVTKAFTTTLLAMLLSDTNGRLNWTSKVSDILGSDFAFTDEERTRELTLRDLLTHRTGLMPADLALFGGYHLAFTSADFARRFRYLPEQKPSRDVFEYNNWVYGLAGYIVEVLSGTSYEETLKKRILQPLGMTNTRVLGKTITTDNAMVAKPYFLVENQLVLTNSSIYDMHPYEAAGAIASSADDMTKWMQFLLRNGKTSDNESLISSDILMEAFKVHEALPEAWMERSLYRPTYPVSSVQVGYGYAWFISTYRGYRTIWHSGEVHSYTTFLHFYPDLDLAIYTSTNGPGIGATGTGQLVISFYILDVLQEQELWLNQSTGCTFPVPWQKPRSASQNNSDVTNLPSECAECFTGVYGHQFFGDLEVKVEPSSESLMLHYGRVKGSLHSTNNKTKFKLDMWEPYKMLSRPGNSTLLTPVTFREKEKGKYQSVDLIYPYSMTFSRKIRFSDEIPTSGHNSGNSNVQLFYAFIISVYMVFSREYFPVRLS